MGPEIDRPFTNVLEGPCLVFGALLNFQNIHLVLNDLSYVVPLYDPIILISIFCHALDLIASFASRRGQFPKFPSLSFLCSWGIALSMSLEVMA